MASVTEHAALKEAMSSLKAHGGSYRELRELLGEGDKTAQEVIAACASLLRQRGHNTCADGLLELKWDAT